MADSLKERFDKAFYGLLDANKRLNEVAEQVKYAGNLIKLNKIKQNQIEQILKGQDNGQQ
jgi:hypothetical protein